MTNQIKNQIRTMRLQGEGYIKIGKALEISDNTVRSFCRRNGLDGKAKNTISCKQCGNLIKIIPKQKPKKFCSDLCRNAWWKEHSECITKKQYMNLPVLAVESILQPMETATENIALIAVT